MHLVGIPVYHSPPSSPYLFSRRLSLKLSGDHVIRLPFAPFLKVRYPLTLMNFFCQPSSMDSSCLPFIWIHCGTMLNCCRSAGHKSIFLHASNLHVITDCLQTTPLFSVAYFYIIMSKPEIWKLHSFRMLDLVVAVLVCFPIWVYSYIKSGILTTLRTLTTELTHQTDLRFLLAFNEAFGFSDSLVEH